MFYFGFPYLPHKTVGECLPFILLPWPGMNHGLGEVTLLFIPSHYSPGGGEGGSCLWLVFFFFLIQSGIRKRWILANDPCTFDLYTPGGPTSSIALNYPSTPYKLGTSLLPCLDLSQSPFKWGREEEERGGDLLPLQASGRALSPWALPFPAGSLPGTFV